MIRKHKYINKIKQTKNQLFNFLTTTLHIPKKKHGISTHEIEKVINKCCFIKLAFKRQKWKNETKTLRPNIVLKRTNINK